MNSASNPSGWALNCYELSELAGVSVHCFKESVHHVDAREGRLSRPPNSSRDSPCSRRAQQTHDARENQVQHP